jgi:asparagine synthase (glutamine-hydrolysing)
MCGICGQFNFGTGAPVSRAVIERMADSIRHRGPDDSGYFIEDNVGLGFRRLSIIDLEGGHQPMSDGDGQVWVIFNGEIYNFPELKRELESFGHIFRNKSDTEVIVHGYKQWGEDVLNHLNGMFGVAIWDVRKKKLIVARDPFGIKLIYYRVAGGELYFGSEIRAVQASMDEQTDIDANAFNLFLRYRFTPSPHTVFEGIRKIAPGSMLICENGTCSERHWYQYKPTPFDPIKNDEEAVEELLAIYRRAIKRHLLSDVPVGLLLSGGLDSGMLLALMREAGNEWQTYTVGYGSSFQDDELEEAAATASFFHARHVKVHLDQQIYEKAFPAIVASLEEPVASSSIVPMYLVCERARQDVKVALIGQGPDELFGGYRRHLGVRYGEMWAKTPSWARASIARAIGRLPRNETLKRGIQSLDTVDRIKRYQHVLSLRPGSEIDALFQDGLLATDIDQELLKCWSDLIPLLGQTDELGGLQFLEMRSTLPDELLMFGDKLSMAHSLEARVPFLDREIVEYVERLPARMKVRGRTQKWIHRMLGKKLLPASIIQRKKKGFAVNVVDGWFRQTVRGKMAELLCDPESLLYGYLQPAHVQRMLKDHQAGREDYHKILFSLVFFEEWLRQQSPASSLASF